MLSSWTLDQTENLGSVDKLSVEFLSVVGLGSFFGGISLLYQKLHTMVNVYIFRKTSRH